MTDSRAIRNKLTLSITWWLPILIVALVWRIVVLASGAVSFHSDEAIIGLMARHINQGLPVPVFFYGQPYMGSLDALLVSVSFRLFGESVLSIRLVQSALYLTLVGTTMLLAFRMSGKRLVATMAGLLIALPATVLTLYTTVSLGGYGETLFIGNLLLLLGYTIYLRKIEENQRWRYWVVLGLLAGVGWWTNSLIVAYIIPVALVLLPVAWRNWQMIVMIAIAFMVGSAPWWLYNLTHDWESVRFLLGGFNGSGPLDRLLGLLLLGLPALMGLRFPWRLELWSDVFSVPVIAIYILLLVVSLVRKPRSAATILLWLMIATFSVIFVGSSFGVDATGRYLLPLLVPIAVLLAMQVNSKRRWLAIGAICLLLATNLIGNVIAMRTVPPGLTPQFNAITDFTNDYDQHIIEFLKEHNFRYGYATYWVAYRLAFLSKEAITLSPELPYKSSLEYINTDRYPAYGLAAAKAEYPILVTANLPQLNQAIIKALTERTISYEQVTIGPYTVFYDLSEKVTPASIGLQNLGQTS